MRKDRTRIRTRTIDGPKFRKGLSPLLVIELHFLPPQRELRAQAVTVVFWVNSLVMSHQKSTSLVMRERKAWTAVSLCKFFSLKIGG